MWAWLTLLAVAVQLFALYRPAPPPTPSDFPQLDKVGHLSMFAAPVFCALLARRRVDGWASRIWLWLVPVIFVAHAVISELIQYAFYTRRSGDPADVLADSVGVALGLGLALLIGRRPAGRGRGVDHGVDRRVDHGVDHREDRR